MKNKLGPVIITGGSGYLESSIIEKLKEEYNIISLDNTMPAKSIPGVEYRKLNISDEKDIEDVFNDIKREKGETIFSVIHLAGYYNLNGEESPLYEDVNIKGTKYILQKLYKDFDVGQLIFSSTMLVYKPSTPGTKITEESPLDEKAWAYPASKLECERIIGKFRGRIPAVILRIGAVYDDFGFAPGIAQQILRISEMHMASFMFPGDGHHKQSTIHIDDLAEAIRMTLRKRSSLPEEMVMSVSEDEVPDYEELQKSIGQLIHGEDIPFFEIPKGIARAGAWIISQLPGPRQSFIKPWMVKYSDANYDLDNKKIKKILGWKPKNNLRNSLPMIIKNLLQYPGTWYRINKISRPPFPGFLRTKLMKQMFIHQGTGVQL